MIPRDYLHSRVILPYHYQIACIYPTGTVIGISNSQTNGLSNYCLVRLDGTTRTVRLWEPDLEQATIRKVNR